MADINNVQFSCTTETPKSYYLVTYTATRIDPSNVQYAFTVRGNIQNNGFLLNQVKLDCTITVAGVSATVNMKGATEPWDNRDGTIKYYTKTLSVTCPSATGGAAQTVTFNVWNNGSYSYVGSNINNSGYSVTSPSGGGNTNCTTPTNVAVSPTSTTATTATLTWSASAGGLNNPVVGYHVQYSESQNGTDWGAWTNIGTFTATSAVVAVGSAGYYRRYQVQARGTQGELWYSTYSAPSNSVYHEQDQNTPPTSPTNVTASPAVFGVGGVDITWTPSTAGSYPIYNYKVYRVILGVGQTLITTVGAYSTTAHDNAPVDGCHYVVAVLDQGGGVNSGMSNTVTALKDLSPPTIVVPNLLSSGTAVTYNHRPFIFITVPTHILGLQQKLIVVVAWSGGGKTYDSELNSEYFSTGGWYSAQTQVVLTCDYTQTGMCGVVAMVVDEDGNIKQTAVRNFEIKNTEIDRFVPNETIVKAAHINDARKIMNDNGNYYKCVPVLLAYQSGDVIAKKTNILYFPYHVIEIRERIEYLINNINSFAGKTLVPLPEWEPIGYERPPTAVIKQLYYQLKAFKSNPNTHEDLSNYTHGFLRRFTQSELYTEVL
jgi:hypothetical protein